MLTINTRNRAVALSRWRKFREKERDFINQKENCVYLKSRILGYLAGDGSICRKEKRSDIRFYPDDKSMVRSFCFAMKRFYRKEPSVKPLLNHYLVRVFSRTVCENLLKEGPIATHNWRVPSIARANKLNKAEWLKAFFDCEAYVGNNRIAVGSVNEVGLNQVRELLSQFSINSRIYQYKPKNKNWSKTFILVISRKLDLYNYHRLIGFNHKFKRNKLKTIILPFAEVA